MRRAVCQVTSVAQALEFTVDVSILSITRFYTARGNFNLAAAHPELS